ncbi:MAG TPA: DEAD/DEAH box helicase, partial [Acetobacteraceae bacterium]|nr:DEAD/DEAH box helicase [Acetobacteraceae bacterium]
MTSFAELGLSAPLLRALEDAGYTTPTPIQAQAIPTVLEGRDLLGIAQTGTGKTAAFALPLLHRLSQTGGRPPRGGCRVLVLSPTRELAGQIADSFKTYGRHLGLSVATVFGGVGMGAQKQALARGVDVLVATPGRLQDHLDQRTARLDMVQALVLDEADQMLDKGFLPAIRRLLKAVPAQRQTLFFSATMPQEIGRLADEMLTEPVRVSVAPVATTAERVAQRVLHVEQSGKRRVLADLLREEGVGRVLVFARTKHGADRIVKNLEQDGIAANAIHGNKAQNARERALAEFKTGRAPVLVATDIAARGIDVDGVTHVIQHDLPDVPETYVHRIGRTARAGASGEAVALCCPEERSQLRAIERLIRQAIPAEDRRSDRSASLAEEPRAAKAPRGRGGQPRQAPRREAQPARGDAPRQAAKRAEHPRGDRSHAENP